MKEKMIFKLAISFAKELTSSNLSYKKASEWSTLIARYQSFEPNLFVLVWGEIDLHEIFDVISIDLSVLAALLIGLGSLIVLLLLHFIQKMIDVWSIKTFITMPAIYSKKLPLALDSSDWHTFLTIVARFSLPICLD